MGDGSFTGEFGIRVKKKALEMGVSFCRVTRGGRWMGILWDSYRALEREHHSLWELY